MLIDVEDLPVDSGGRATADVIVVGAGAAGLVLAMELARLGRDVLVLEAGGMPPDDSHFDHFNGDNVGLPYDLVASRYRALGGATNRWAGWCRPLDEQEMTYRAWLGGQPWPMSHEELTGYAKKAAALVDLGPWEWDVHQIESRMGNAMPTPLGGLGRNISSVIWRFATEPLSFAQRFRSFIDGSTSRIALHAPVIDISIQDRRARAVTVRLRNGSNRVIDCRTVVLAAGGIENVRLLLELQARLEGVGQSIDSSGWLGRGWQEHPHVAVGTAWIPESVAEGPLWLYTGRRIIDGVPVLAGLTMSHEFRDRHRMGAVSVTIDPQFGLTDRFAEGVRAIASSVSGEQVHPHLLFARAESRTVRGSTVTLSNRRDPLGRQQARVNWRMARGDFRDLGLVASTIGRAFAAHDVGVVRVDAGRGRLAQRVWGGAHHIGGARMSSDPKLGVTDGNGAVHAVSNLFVTGSAVFPSGGFSNPTLTIMALALRQADFIAKADS